MAKPRKSRQGSRRCRPVQCPKPAPASVSMPSAQTLCRSFLADTQTRDQMRKAISRLKPLLWLRDKEEVKQIKRTKTAEELLDLAHLVGGLGEIAWQDRIRQFGPELLPLISERLRTARNVRDPETREKTFEKLIDELRWRGDAGAQVLMERFDNLNDYGKSLACVVLGLLETQASTDKLWSFYQRVKHNRRKRYFVGALWGLIDLKDKRVGGALADLVSEGRDFYELFGFLSLAGDTRVVKPLLLGAMQKPREENWDTAMALVSIAHRIGRDVMLGELDRIASPEEPREAHEALVDEWLAKPISEVQEYFALFYRGLTPDDVARLFPG